MKNNLSVINKFFIISSIVLLAFKNSFAYDIDIKITGEIHIPPCIINNGNSIEVDFEDIAMHKIGAIGNSELQKTTKVALQCDFYDGRPYLLVTGSKAINTEALNTTGINTNKLGIALYLGDSISNANIAINSQDNNGYGQDITTGILQVNVKDSEFIFTSVPVKIGLDRLDSGPFTAIATFIIHYF